MSIPCHANRKCRGARSDDLFHLTYYGSGQTFFLDYYAPERARSNPLKASIYHTRMIKGMGRIYLDSPSQLWERLFRPIQETFAHREGVHSFCKELAPDLRDFLLEHLDFIERMMQASGETLQVLPAPVSFWPPGKTIFYFFNQLKPQDKQCQKCLPAPSHQLQPTESSLNP